MIRPDPHDRERGKPMSVRAALLFLGLVAATTASAAPVTLGGFSFDPEQFGDSLAQGDGGGFAQVNWLNVNDADPGSPGYLTGADFDTGIGRIRDLFDLTYTIGYATPIVNGAGADFGVVTAYLAADVILTINGNTQTIAAATAQATGVSRAYWFGSSTLGPQTGALFVMAVDLSLFGVASGASVNSITLAGYDVSAIRIAGFDRGLDLAVPAPPALAAFGVGLLALAATRPRRRPRA
jgi:hypothetical protein